MTVHPQDKLLEAIQAGVLCPPDLAHVEHGDRPAELVGDPLLEREKVEETRVWVLGCEGGEADEVDLVCDPEEDVLLDERERVGRGVFGSLRGFKPTQSSAHAMVAQVRR